MSYDIYLTIDTGGESPAYVGRDWNYTSNCGPMWRAAGAELAEFHGKPASECIPVLQAAITELEANPEKYRAMDSPNGWGVYDRLVPALTRLLENFQAHPRATVEVSR